MAAAHYERQLKNKNLVLNNMHNLTKIDRLKGEQGIFSDYPHHYKMKLEGKSDVVLFGLRSTENSEFIISSVSVRIA